MVGRAITPFEMSKERCPGYRSVPDAVEFALKGCRDREIMQCSNEETIVQEVHDVGAAGCARLDVLYYSPIVAVTVRVHHLCPPVGGCKCDGV